MSPYIDSYEFFKKFTPVGFFQYIDGIDKGLGVASVIGFAYGHQFLLDKKVTTAVAIAFAGLSLLAKKYAENCFIQESNGNLFREGEFLKPFYKTSIIADSCVSLISTVGFWHLGLIGQRGLVTMGVIAIGTAMLNYKFFRSAKNEI